MKKLQRTIKKTTTRGTAIMMTKVKYSVSAIVLVCAIALGALAIMGPKHGLQLAPIDTKATAYLEKMNYIRPDEQLTAFKATGYFSYDQGIAITTKRIFVYAGNKVHSIDLDKISMFVIKDTELGHKLVLVSASIDGAISFEVYHTNVKELIKLLKVNNNIIRDHSKDQSTVADRT